MYHIERTDDLSGLMAESAAWDDLSGGVPLRESAWLGNWWAVYGRGLEAYVVTVRDRDAALCGLLPLYRLKTAREGRTLSAMGDGTTCTDHFSLLARERDSQAIAAAVGQWLARASRDARDGWDLIDIDGIVGGDRTAAAMTAALCGEGATSHASSRMSTWIKDTSDDWEAHLARLSKTHRRKTRQHRKRLEAGREFSLRIAASKEEVRTDLNQLMDLHQRRWTSVGEPGSFATLESRQFLHSTAQALFDRGQLQLASIVVDGETAGSELRIIGRDRMMYCYCTGMDPAFADLEPGRLLNIQGLVYAYEQQLRGIDCLRGDEPYKARLLAEPRPLIRLRIVAPSLLPRLRHAAWLTQFELKQFLRRRTGRSVVQTLSLA
ncbi:GNAT family N-acetyltransferase [Candidatus Laterigemmans baculatus]|uniref:GNAT family N-acetyltransferase n=1 Tax=Candidatus Laterigemmans baculatus TaxID=2770505 RepID=UPI0013D92672|nr:GNAT family N-acetyltransferase [Candidatus Laterigemmans baculatus]